MMILQRETRPGRGRGKPSPALVIALLALLVALGGTSYAAVSLPAGSVGTAQLRDRAVTRAKLSTGAVTTAKVSGGAISGGKLQDGAVSARKIQDRAITGAKLAPGSISLATVPAGAGVRLVYRYGTVTVGPAQRLPAYVACPAGSNVVGGGMTAPSPNIVLNDTAPFDSRVGNWTGGPSDSWGVSVTNTDPNQTFVVGIYAVCIVAGTVR